MYTINNMRFHTAYVVRVVTKFMWNPSEKHQEVVKGILQCLRGGRARNWDLEKRKKKLYLHNLYKEKKIYICITSKQKNLFSITFTVKYFSL